MKIANSIYDGDTLVGYRVAYEDFDASLDYPIRGLYLPQVIEDLTSCGYKYYDYHGDIETPDGTPIKDLPRIAFSEIDKAAWNNVAMSVEAQVYTDAECARYYTLRVSNAIIEFKKESSYEINTREEFLDYIEAVRQSYSLYGVCGDNRPINSFVNPECLFTIDEILDPELELADKLKVLNTRHIFYDYSSYQNLIGYLKSKGILDKDNPTIAEFLKAYYAWGPDGIRDNCIDIKYKFNVDGPFFSHMGTDDQIDYSGDAEKVALSDRTIRPFVMARDGIMHSMKLTEGTNDKVELSDFGRDRLSVMNQVAFTRCKRPEFDGYKYVVDWCGVSMISDRVYITYQASNGFRYIYKISHDKAVFYNAQNHSPYIEFERNFGIRSTIGNVIFGIDEIASEIDYVIWNFAMIRGSERIAKEAIKPPVDSTYQMLLNVGYDPKQAIEYMANHLIANKKMPGNEVLWQGTYYERVTEECVNRFCSKEIPDDVIEQFNINPDDIETKEDLINAMDVDTLLDRREKMDSGEILEGDDGWDPTYVTKELQAAYINAKHMTNPIQKAEETARLEAIINEKEARDVLSYYADLKFVNDCIDGQVILDAMADGYKKDHEGDLNSLLTILMSIVYAELGDDITIEGAMDVLKNLETNRLINFSKVFKARDAAYKGYLVDYAIASFTRTRYDICDWAYITKTFREIGMKPDTEARPYMCEMLVLPSTDKFSQQIREGVIEEIDNQINGLGLSDDFLISDARSAYYGISEKQCAKLLESQIASKIIFNMIAKKASGDFIYEETIFEDKKIKIEFGEKTWQALNNVIHQHDKYLRYATLYDIVDFGYQRVREFAPAKDLDILDTEQQARMFAKGISKIYAVNANIDLWSVTSKKGFSINQISFMHSYFKQEAVAKQIGMNTFESAKQNRLIGSYAIMEVLKNYRYPKYSDIATNGVQLDINDAHYPEDLENYYDIKVFEPAEVYVKRCALYRTLAKSNNAVAYHIPMKQDILYGDLADKLGIGKDIDQVIYKPGEDDLLSPEHLTSVKVPKEKMYNVKLLEVNNRRNLTLLTTEDITLHEFMSVYVELFFSNVRLALIGRRVVAPIDCYISEMSDVEYEDFLSKYSATVSDKHFILGINGLYRIGD